MQFVFAKDNMNFSLESIVILRGIFNGTTLVLKMLINLRSTKFISVIFKRIKVYTGEV